MSTGLPEAVECSPEFWYPQTCDYQAVDSLYSDGYLFSPDACLGCDESSDCS